MGNAVISLDSQTRDPDLYAADELNRISAPTPGLLTFTVALEASGQSVRSQDPGWGPSRAEGRAPGAQCGI